MGGLRGGDPKKHPLSSRLTASRMWQLPEEMSMNIPSDAFSPVNLGWGPGAIYRYTSDLVQAGDPILLSNNDYIYIAVEVDGFGYFPVDRGGLPAQVRLDWNNRPNLPRCGSVPPPHVCSWCSCLLLPMDPPTFNVRITDHQGTMGPLCS